MSKKQRQVLDGRLRKLPQPSGSVSLEQLRAGFAQFMGTLPVPKGLQLTAIKLGDQSALLVERREEAHLGTILYFHGGSFSLGSPTTGMPMTGNLVRRTGVRAISLDYRLAPEHPFPAAIEDGVAAYRVLLEGGTRPDAIVFAGDSAGGGLTVTTCLAARDAGLPMPAAIAAFSPGLDHTRTGKSMASKEGLDPFFTRAGMARTGDMYLAGQNPNQPLLAPAVLADLTGLPPMLLQVGTNELLLDDAVRLATRAVAAEVDVILDVTAGVPHVFQAFTGDLEEAAQSLDRMAMFLSQRLNPTRDSWLA